MMPSLLTMPPPNTTVSAPMCRSSTRRTRVVTTTRLVTLLQRVPLSLVDRERLLPLAEKSRFFRAAVILLKAVSSFPFRGIFFVCTCTSATTFFMTSDQPLQRHICFFGAGGGGSFVGCRVRVSRFGALCVRARVVGAAIVFSMFCEWNEVK